jgi:hypothetical protein
LPLPFFHGSLHFHYSLPCLWVLALLPKSKLWSLGFRTQVIMEEQMERS